MSPIRALERGDLSRVADLYEKTMRGNRAPAPAGLRASFERFFFDCPGSDPEIPSLVFEASDGKIGGFLGIHVRRMLFDGEPVRLACSGQLVTSSDGPAAAGILLLRKLFAGPQDLTITDGATATVQRMWGALGGQSHLLGCIRWTRILRPVEFASVLMRRRRSLAPAGAVLAPLSRLCDVVASRAPPARFRPSATFSPPETLTAGVVAECLPRLAARKSLRPDYDAPFLEWLFARMAEAESRGALHACAVRRDGEVMGWFVYYLRSRDVAHVVQVAAAPESIDEVVDHMFQHMWRQGAAASQGRVEPDLLPALSRHHALLEYCGPFALIHSPRPAILQAIGSGNAFLTRQEGEWWMSFHRERYS